MKKYILSLSILLFYFNLSAQNLSVFNIDPSKYPLMRAEFYAIDAVGNQILNLSESNFDISENGVSRTVTNVSCPAPRPPIATSTVLSMDISGSMLGTNIKLAKEAAKAWVEGMPPNISECAITSFSDNEYINQDFTNDKQLLLKKIETFQTMDGTNYDKAFLDPICGNIKIDSRGKYKRVIVFLSDGLPNFKPDVNKIIALANTNSISIYCVTLGMPCPDVLKSIASATGAEYFENVTTVNQAREIYNRILRIVQRNSSCTIEWISGNSCMLETRKLIVTNLINNSSSTQYYDAPKNSVSDLTISPGTVIFRNVVPGKQKDTTIKIKAFNDTFDVTDIVSDNPLFFASPTAFKLAKGDSINIKVSFAPTDSSYSFSKVKIINALCPKIFYVSGGYLGKKPVKNTLKVIFPNGGEKLVAGSDTLIKWTGISEADTVRLEYSYDSGNSWHLINHYGRGLSYNWKNIPKTPSSNCLIHANQTQSASNDWQTESFIGYSSAATRFNYSHDSTRFLYLVNGKLFIYNATTLSYDKELKGISTYFLSYAWNTDDTWIVAGTNDGQVCIFDSFTGELINTYRSTAFNVNGIAIKNDNSQIYTAGNDYKFKVWDTYSGKITQSTNIGLGTCLDISPDGQIISCGNSDNTSLINAKTFKVISNLYTVQVTSTVFSPDGSKIISSGNGTSLINVPARSVTYTIAGQSSRAAISPDWKVLTSGFIPISLYNLSDGKFIRNLYTNSYCSSFTPDGSKILTHDGFKFCLIDTTEHRPISDTLKMGTNTAITAIIPSPNDSTLCLLRSDGQVNLWDFPGDSLLNILSVVNQKITNVLYHPNGRFILTNAQNNTNESVVIWNTDGNVSHASPYPAVSKTKLTAIAIGPSGSYISGYSGSISITSPSTTFLTCADDGIIRVWSMDDSTGALLGTSGTYMDHKSYALAMSPDYKYIISGGASDGMIYIWDFHKHKLLDSIYTRANPVSKIIFSPDSAKFLCICGNYLQVFDFASHKELVSFYISGISNIMNSSDGMNYLITVGGELLSVDAKTYVIKNYYNSFNQIGLVHQSDTLAYCLGNPVLKMKYNVDNFPALSNNFKGQVTNCKFSPDGKNIAAFVTSYQNLPNQSSSAYTLNIFDRGTGVEQFQSLMKFACAGTDNGGHSQKPTGLAFTADGLRAVSSSLDSTLKLWDLTTGQVLITMHDHPKIPTGVAISPDGKYIVSTCEDYQLKIFDGSTGKYLNRMLGHRREANDVCFSPDSRHAYSCGNDSTVFEWDLEREYFSGSMSGHKDKVMCIDVSADGAKLATGSMDTTIIIWEVKSGSPLMRLKTSSPVKKVKFIPDGSKVISSDNFGKISVWDLIDGIKVIDINAGSYINDISVSPDGRRFITGSDDGSIRSWLIDSTYSIQDDESDNLWSIVAPNLSSLDINFGAVEVGTVKDSALTNFILNTGTYKARIDSIYFGGADPSNFEIVSGFPPFIAEGSDSQKVEFRFKPKDEGVKSAIIYIRTQTDTLKQKIFGKGFVNLIALSNNDVEFDSTLVKTSKDSLCRAILQNTGTYPALVSSIAFLGPNINDFRLASGSVDTSFVLKPGEFAALPIRYTPMELGLGSGRIAFYCADIAKPVEANLYGTGFSNGPRIRVANQLKVHNLVCESSALDTIIIDNVGFDSLFISDAKLSGGQQNDFIIVSPAAPVTVLPDSSLQIIVLYLPQNTGQSNAELTVISNAFGDSVKIFNLLSSKENISFNAGPQLIDFGYLKMKVTRDTSISVVNTGSILSTFLLSASSNITIDKNVLKIAARDSIPVNIHYKGIDRPCTFADTVIVEDTICNKIQEIIINGIVNPPFSSKITVGNGEASPGEILEIPITISNPDSLRVSTATGFSGELNFNASLLAVLNYPSGAVLNGIRTIPLNNLSIKNTDIAKIKFKAALGNADRTALWLTNYRINGDSVTLDTANGSFKLLGICYQGGQRLLQTNPAGAEIISVSPNPATDLIDIKINLIEYGETRLSLYDLSGKVIKEILCENISASGVRNFSVRTDKISDGKYILQLETPSAKLFQLISVVK
ncbi:MAG: choice-of-anchor D domain-containing protein [Candidatus Kapabacteria bacterium]|nr:choice-of-anchor D domain-containing protein [Candidatus Kapabacteria bacterium]